MGRVHGDGQGDQFGPNADVCEQCPAGRASRRGPAFAPLPRANALNFEGTVFLRRDDTRVRPSLRKKNRPFEGPSDTVIANISLNPIVFTETLSFTAVAQLGVWQQLSTWANDEVMSSDNDTS